LRGKAASDTDSASDDGEDPDENEASQPVPDAATLDEAELWESS
jgi:hypothetical protein